MTTSVTPNLVDRATEAVPEHSALTAAIAELDARTAEAQTAVAWIGTEHDVIRKVVDQVVGGRLPDDLGADLVDHRRIVAEHQAALDVAGAVRKALRARISEGHAQHADKALAVLRVDLEDITARARYVLAELDGIDSAASAIASNRVEQWREISDLAQRYTEVRELQALVTSRALSTDPQRLRTRPTLADQRLVELHGHVREPARWVDLATVRVGPGRPADGAMTLGERGPQAQVTRPPWSTGDPLADLEFVTRHDVEPWLPDVLDLEHAAAQTPAPTDEEDQA